MELTFPRKTLTRGLCRVLIMDVPLDHLFPRGQYTKRSRNVGPDSPALPPITYNFPFNTAEALPKTSEDMPLLHGTLGRHSHFPVCQSNAHHDTFPVTEFQLCTYIHSSTHPSFALASATKGCARAFFHTLHTLFRFSSNDLGNRASTSAAMSSGNPGSNSGVSSEVEQEPRSDMAGRM